MWLVKSQHFHKHLQHDQGLVADLVEGVTDRRDDGRGGTRWGDGAGQEALHEGQGVNLHVAVSLAELYARDQHPVKFGLGKQMRKFHQKPSLVSMDFSFICLCRAFTMLKATEPSSAGVLDIILKNIQAILKSYLLYVCGRLGLSQQGLR